MKLVCGNACGWESDGRPSVDDVLRLAADVGVSIANGELTPEDVIPSGRCPRCGAYAYQELPDPKTVSCIRARLARLAMAGTVRKVDGFQRPGVKAPGSIARGLRRALAKAEVLGSMLKVLESSWLDWKHPNGERPDFERLTAAWKQGNASLVDFLPMKGALGQFNLFWCSNGRLLDLIRTELEDPQGDSSSKARREAIAAVAELAHRFIKPEKKS